FQGHLLLPLAHPRIEIRPGCPTNWIFLGSKDLLPVTLFGSSTFDVARVVVSSVRLNGAAPKGTQLADKDGDGQVDLTLKCRQSAARTVPVSQRVAAVQPSLPAGLVNRSRRPEQRIALPCPSCRSKVMARVAGSTVPAIRAGAAALWNSTSFPEAARERSTSP